MCIYGLARECMFEVPTCWHGISLSTSMSYHNVEAAACYEKKQNLLVQHHAR
jgi:hypothetical protein